MPTKLVHHHLICLISLTLCNTAAFATGSLLAFSRDSNGIVQEVVIWDNVNSRWVIDSVTLDDPVAYITGDGFLIVQVDQNAVRTYGWYPGLTSLSPAGFSVPPPASVQTLPHGNSLAVIPIDGKGDRQQPIIWTANTFGYVQFPVSTPNYQITPLETNGYAVFEAASGFITVHYWTSGLPQMDTLGLSGAEGVQHISSNGAAAMAVLEDGAGNPQDLVGLDAINGIVSGLPIALNTYQVRSTEDGFVVLDQLSGSGACLYGWQLPGVSFTQTCVPGDVSFGDALVAGVNCISASADSDCDGDVDLPDFQRFSQQYTGPGRP